MNNLSFHHQETKKKSKINPKQAEINKILKIIEKPMKIKS